MNSIRQRVLLFLLIAGFVPLAILVVTTITVIQREVMKSERAKVSDVAQQLSHHLAEIMDRVARDLESLKTQPVLTDSAADPELQLREMRRLVGVYEIFSDISLYNTAGLLINSTTENHPIFKEYTDWFRQALDGRTVISSPERKQGGGDALYLIVYLPVLTDAGAVCQVIKARLSFDRVIQVVQGVKVGERGSIVLIDDYGRIIGGREPKLLLEEFDPSQPPGRWASQRIGAYKRPSGAEYLYAAEILPAAMTKVGSSWTLLALKPMEEVKAVITQSRTVLAFAAAATFAVAILLGYSLSLLISGPLEKAGNVAKEIAAGNLSVQMDTRGLREIGKMAESFNRMSTQIKQHNDQLNSLVARRTYRLRASEENLRQTSAMLLASYEATREAVLVIDPDGKIVAANRQLETFFGIGSRIHPGMAISEIEATILGRFEKRDGFRSAWDSLALDPAARMDAEWKLVEPEERVLSIYSAPVTDVEGSLCARLWMFHDATEQKRLQEGLQQAQKMEAVGRLAGGVAHDFNNLLTGIIGKLSLAELGGSATGETPAELMSSARRAGERAAQLVKQLLGFSRRTHLQFRIADCNAVVRDVEGLLTHSIDPRIKIVVETEEALWGAKVDPNQIEQVVMNMAVNAKDAMKGPGTITVTTQNVTLEARDLSENVRSATGDYVAITIADDGEGMPPEILSKIYEPFFTTKEQGKGTGLGLATSYGIIRQHGGWIDCTSVLGEGTTFTIYLPKAAERAAEAIAERPAVNQREQRGSETILLVDDEDVVRTVAQSVLKHHGYQTLAAHDGLEAIALFESGEHEIDLVLLDLTMPNLSGADTFKRIRAEFGDVPVIVCSGYTVDLDEFEAENGARPNGLVQKPYNIADLAQKVREALDDACLTA